ncbi:MAG: glutamyl-tRNA amidotransferase [Anaerolineae bacterium SM23_ 63]|nr:MAG: glutamyl-tRNA amidotransferase [Anaerolineae bacterium SM23_ 63]HEY46403.1 Asp-tRNA(Asn)/Glu-tRNA(Gln) amidotransferase subunit GatA [Anaerolineae bacterium]
MTDLTDLTLLEAAAALRSGDVSSRELTQACLDRIEDLEPKIHAFLSLTPDLALKQAEDADRQLSEWRREGVDPPSPTWGIPMGIKDVLCLEGVPTTCGSKILEGFRPPYTATSVERLIDAGVVVLGKTNTDEFAMGSSTENSAYGSTFNPWDLTRVPGGSSGGSAASVAANMCYAALGTDTGGSVRQPASFCGVTGIKTSYGRVSRYGLIAYGSSLDTVGALAHSAADLLPIFHTISGHDPLDSTSMPEPVPHVALDGTDLTGLRIGVPKEYFIEGMQGEVETAVHDAVRIFEALGAVACEISLPHTDLALPVYYIIAPAEASANLARYDAVRYGPRIEAEDLRGQYFATRGALFGQEVKRRIMLGTYALSAGYYDAYYGQAQKVRTLIKGDFESAFKEVDLIACPVAPTTAFRMGEHSEDPLSMYLEDVFTLPANLAGVPGIAFPVGFDSDRLPIGMQLNAPHLGEAILFRATYAYQEVTSWHKERPSL